MGRGRALGKTVGRGMLLAVLAVVVGAGTAAPARAAGPLPIPVSGTRLTADPPSRAPEAGPADDTPCSQRLSPDEKATFWAYDYHTGRYYQVRATLRHGGPNAWIYVEEGNRVDGGDIAELAVLFEDIVYLRLRNLYGHEPDPGIDCEHAITILLLNIRDAYDYKVAPFTYISGYFDWANQFTQAQLDDERLAKKSNEREMVYLDVLPTLPGDTIIKQSLAHEFAHLIQWRYDPEEEAWLEEGLSELAVYLCGLGHPRDHVEAFLKDPEVSLTSWAGDIRDYGKVYLFLYYLYEQVGTQRLGWLRELVADPTQGMPSLTRTLPGDRTMDELFRDFGLALQVDDPEIGSGQYGFRNLELDRAERPTGFGPLAAHAHGPAPLRELTVTLPPWSLRVDRFELGREALEIELTPQAAICLGAGWLPGARLAPGSTRHAVACPSAGDGLILPFGATWSGRDAAVALTVAANTWDEPVDLTLALLPETSTTNLGTIHLPFASRR